MHHNNSDQAQHQQRIAGLIHDPKLTWGQVNEIRRTYVIRSRTHGLKALAEQYGVSVNNIHKILRGQTWKTIEGDGNTLAPLANRKTPQQMTKAYVQHGQNMDALRLELDRLLSR